MRPERLELPTFRSGVERATNCAKAPKVLTCDGPAPIVTSRLLPHLLSCPQCTDSLFLSQALRDTKTEDFLIWEFNQANLR